MQPTLVSQQPRPTMPAVTAALARRQEAEVLGVAVATLATTVTEIMPSIVGVITEDQAERLRTALRVVRGC